MRMLGAVTALALVLVTPAHAEEPAACEVPAAILQTESVLSHIAGAIRERKKLDVLVLGTGSSVLPGPNGAASAYPARLEASLRQRLSGIEVNVAAEAKSGRSAAEMAKGLDRVIRDRKPDLLVWQTGTYEAMHGLDPDEFRAEVEDGIERLKAAGVDTILINMQYSPRTEAMLALDPYVEAMRLAAREQDVPLFDRLAIMRYWNEAGAFDLNATGKDPAMAQQVHDCLGRALASVVIDAGQLSAFTTKASR